MKSELKPGGGNKLSKMNTRKITTAGVLYWTPAPAHSSTPSSVISEDEWEHEQEKQEEKDDDFASQMDENGTIRLLEELEDVVLGETCGDADTEFNANLNLGPPTPEEANSSENDRELSYNLKDQSYIESPEEEEMLLLLHKASEDRSQRKEEQVKFFLPESNRHLGMPEEAEDGKKTERSVETILVQSEEMSTAPGIEAETLPDISSSESIQDSPWSPKSSHRVKLTTSPQSAAMFSDIVSDRYNKGTDEALTGTRKPDKHHKHPTHSPRKSKLQPSEATYSRTHCLGIVKTDSTRHTTSSNREHGSSRTRRKAAKVHEARKKLLSYPTPDFSKVEPRVHFPKGGYVPPKSRLSFRRESLSPEPSLVFKSPADIVKEALLNTTDESPAPSDSFGPPSSTPHSVVPQEFRCQQQDTTLFNQLQEEHIRALIKLAEAENTIDRLRQGAKVNLFSDPPKPGYLVQSGLNKETSKVLMLDFPQVQRAEINSAPLHLNEQSRHQGSSSACPFTRSPGPQVLTQILFSQAEKFLRQLQTFKDLLKSKTLKPVELMKGVSQLAKGLDSLEKSYLLKKDQHKLLQQEEADTGHFDPEQELEGLIFQCGLGLEELRAQVEQMQQEELTCEVPLSRSPNHTSSSVASEGKESQTHPQSPPVSPLVHEREAADVEGNLFSQQNNKQTLNSLYLNTLDSKHKCLEQDTDRPVNHNQSLKQLPQSQRHGAHHFAALRTDEEDREGQAQLKINPEVQVLPQRKSDHLDSPPVILIKQQTSRFSPPLGRVLNQSSSPSVPCPSCRSVEMVKSCSSSLSSLGEITASERRNSKLRTQIRRVLSQDGIISPEMDSGFVGSENSHLTPAATTSPVHQGEPKSSVSVPQEGNSGKLQTGPVTAPCSVSSLLHNPAVVPQERSSQLSPDMARRSRQGQGRSRFSDSLQCQNCQLDQSRAESGTSGFWVQSDSYRFNDGSISSLSSSSSSPAACYHQGNSLGAPTSCQVGDPSASVQTLRAELSRLEEKVDSCMKNQKPKSSPKTTPSAQKNYIHIYTSTPHDRSDELGIDSCRERRDGPTADDVGESTTRQATKKRSSSAHRRGPQLDVYACSREPPYSSHCHHCLLSSPKLNRRPAPDCHRVSDSSKHTTCHTAQPPSGDVSSRYFTTTAPPAPPLHCVLECPPPVLLYSLPLYNAPSNKRSISSGGRGCEEGKDRRTHSLSIDQLYVDSSLDRALDRAIRAARRMKSTSGHMAYSLAEGLHYLKQS